VLRNFRSSLTASGLPDCERFGRKDAPPLWQQESGANGITITTLDGLGRAIRVQRSDGNGVVQSYTDTLYAPCACSPLGKIQKVSQPYPAGGTPVWTVYTYDGLGRTVSVQQPDGASTTTYAYLGNQTTVTDPAGKWKTFTKDVSGNLTAVVEPDPSNQPSGTLTTSYTYDWMYHVSQVSMTRGTAPNAATRTRTFVDSDAGLLTSATNLENGTVSYYYNGNNTLQYKHDARGQDTVYTYNGNNQVTMIQKYPQGKANAEDTCQRVGYAYGTSASNYSYNRLTSVSYERCIPNATPIGFLEQYTYNPPGGVMSKQLSEGNPVAPRLRIVRSVRSIR
jgi:YD repeat-containing protein